VSVSPSSFDRVAAAADFIRQRIPTFPQIAIVLGSGQGDFAATLTSVQSIDYSAIPHWPVSRVVGHAGKLVVGTVAQQPSAVLAGRVHFYEGHDLPTVTFGIRVLGMLGVKVLVLTNAAGGVNTALEPGSFMVIDDHINLLGGNPLIGENDDRFGVRFPDMSDVYSSRLRRIADDAAASLSVPLSHGVYVAWNGPSYETPAEIRFLRSIGGDAVGMSTVPEAIVARHMRIEVLGISCITNMAAGVVAHPLNHQEVLDTAARVRGTFTALLNAIIPRIQGGNG
jgi:purine-nucleoside phosphorylase